MLNNSHNKAHQETHLNPLFPLLFLPPSTSKKRLGSSMEKSLAADPTQQRDTPENQQYKAACYAENPAFQHSDGKGATKISRRKWSSWFTQRGFDPPFLLKYRSSDTFIIGTVTLAVFTVSHHHHHHHHYHCYIQISNLHYCIAVKLIQIPCTKDMFLYGVIVPVIPFAISSRSHVDEDRVQYWVSVLVAVYGASLLAFSPVCGWLADRGSSRRMPLLVGLLVLLGSTVLLNLGNSIGVLITGRVLQGASAAVV